MNIDNTYFVADLHIENATVGHFDNAELSKAAELTRQIAIYEPELLKLILGATLYAEYLVGGTQWDAFKAKIADATNKVSPITNYVFFNYWPTFCIQSTMAGAVISKTENSITLSVADKQRMVWNRMRRLLIDVFDWMDENRTDYEHDDVTLDTTNWENLTTYMNWAGL